MTDENNLGTNAFLQSHVDNDQNRLKTFLVDSHRFNVNEFDQDLRTSLHSELFNPLKNTNTGRMTEEGLQKHLASSFVQKSDKINKTLEISNPNVYENKRYSNLAQINELVDKTIGISYDSINKYLTPSSNRVQKLK